MIKRNYLLEWAKSFPWSHDEFVEQDLLISRAIVAIYSDPFLASRLAWRGGTALYKLYVTPQPRYSEDIDLVLINPEPMGPILDRLRDVLSFVPDQQAKGKRYNHVMKLRYMSENEAPIPMRIKVEINCNEHFSELGFAKVLACWRRYKAELGEELPSWREYVGNVEAKLADPGYRSGMDGLLRPGVEFDALAAWKNIRAGIVDRLMTDRDLSK